MKGLGLGVVAVLLMAAGCGELSDVSRPSPDAAAPESGVPSPSEELTDDAVLAGACTVRVRSPDPSQCKGVAELLECSRRECGGPEMCAEVCASFLECVDASSEEDRCTSTFTCGATDTQECQLCQAELQSCILLGQCTGVYTCGTTVERGSCSKLEACCNTQAEPGSCLGWMYLQRMFGGDVGCQALLDDPSFLDAFAAAPTCEF